MTAINKTANKKRREISKPLFGQLSHMKSPVWLYPKYQFPHMVLIYPVEHAPISFLLSIVYPSNEDASNHLIILFEVFENLQYPESG